MVRLHELLRLVDTEPETCCKFLHPHPVQQTEVDRLRWGPWDADEVGAHLVEVDVRIGVVLLHDGATGVVRQESVLDLTVICLAPQLIVAKRNVETPDQGCPLLISCRNVLQIQSATAAEPTRPRAVTAVSQRVELTMDQTMFICVLEDVVVDERPLEVLELLHGADLIRDRVIEKLEVADCDGRVPFRLTLLQHLLSRWIGTVRDVEPVEQPRQLLGRPEVHVTVLGTPVISSCRELLLQPCLQLDRLRHIDLHADHVHLQEDRDQRGLHLVHLTQPLSIDQGQKVVCQTERDPAISLRVRCDDVTRCSPDILGLRLARRCSAERFSAELPELVTFLRHP